VRGGFSAPRKQLRNSLTQGLGLGSGAEDILVAAGVSRSSRPADLSIDQWLAVSRACEAA
jgi:hypothetical protein